MNIIGIKKLETSVYHRDEGALWNIDAVFIVDEPQPKVHAALSSPDFAGALALLGVAVSAEDINHGWMEIKGKRGQQAWGRPAMLLGESKITLHCSTKNHRDIDAIVERINQG